MDLLTLGLDAGVAVLALLVQAIIYPTLRNIAEDQFHQYHNWYTQRITWFVGPLMVGQVLAYSYRLVNEPTSVDWIAAVLILVAWVVTGLRAVPHHARLALEGQEAETIAGLLQANGVRTVAWVGVLILWIWR